jgi:hypothetical protein
MGILYDRVAGVTTWAQENRLRMNFTVGVTADHGLTFGAFTRVQITNGGALIDPSFAGSSARGGVFSGSRVWVEASGLRLTFGNQDGAFRGAGTAYGYLGGCAVGYVGGILCGDTAGLLGRTQAFESQPVTGAGIPLGWGGGGNPARARLDYTFGDTRVALSADRDGSTELGVRSSFDAFTVALGYSNRARTNGRAALAVAGSSTALSAHYNGGSWGVGALVARLKTGATSVTTWSVTGNVELGGGNLLAYVGRVPTAFGATTTDNSYGIHYGYGLGGGATVSFGMERVGTTTSAAVGVAFNF